MFCPFTDALLKEINKRREGKCFSLYVPHAGKNSSLKQMEEK
jgi:hypothetical protein